MREIEFVALDCETTGLDSERDNIIELGAVKFSVAKNLASFDSLFCSPTKIPQFVERLTGIKNSDLNGAPKFAEKQEEIQNFCSDHILVGHNLQFDLDFLKAHGVDMNDHLVFDTFKIAGLLLPRGESLSLENLAQKFGLVHDDAHRALADAEATRDLLRVFLRIAKSFPRERWEKIRQLQSVESWIKKFAELVLDSDLEAQKYEVPAGEMAEIRTDVVEQLATTFQKGDVLLEATANAAEIISAAKTLNEKMVMYFKDSFDVRRSLQQFDDLVVSYAPHKYICQEKLNSFLSHSLSELELSLAAKVILHPEFNFYDFNFTRAEIFTFDRIAGDRACSEEHAQCPFAQHLEKTVDAPIVLSSHESLLPDSVVSGVAIVADAISLLENLARADSLVLDFPTLEEVSPQHLEKLQIWWGVLGLLIREAAPRFGKVELQETRALSHFSKAIEMGKSFLADAEADLPPRIAKALQSFLNLNPAVRSLIRTNAMGEITLVVEPLEIALPKNSKSIFIDAAADATDQFQFAKKTLQLSDNFPTEKLEHAEELPRFLVADDAPDPAAPQFFPAVERFLLRELPSWSGLSAIVFPNRMEAGNFAERATAELDCPVFFRKVPTAEKLASLDKAAVILTTGSKFVPAGLSNFVSVKLPFIVRDGADWQTETLPATALRFKKMWMNFIASTQAEKFLALDSRILSKKYGQSFLDVVPASYEKLTIR